MKVVHVIPALTKGGAERVAVDLANHAAAAGHSVTLLTAIRANPAHLPAPIAEEVERRTISPHGESVKSSYAALPAWMWRNRSWLLSRDIIHCHLTFGAVFGTLLQSLRRIMGASLPRVIETYHAVGVPIPAAKRAFHARLLAGRDAVAFMAEDPFWTRFRRRHPGRRFETIANGVSSRSDRGLATDKAGRRRRFGISPACRLVGSIGRLVPERRPDLLLSAFAETARVAGDDVDFLLGGEGTELEATKRQARALGLSERVHLPGLILDPAEPFGAIDLYLTINVGPLTGIAAIEAAMAGLPIVALQLDPSYAPSPDDWIWSSPDPVALGRRAAELLDDREALAALAKKQKDHADEHYSVDRMAQDYQRFYEAALEAAEGR